MRRTKRALKKDWFMDRRVCLATIIDPFTLLEEDPDNSIGSIQQHMNTQHNPLAHAPRSVLALSTTLLI